MRCDGAQGEYSFDDGLVYQEEGWERSGRTNLYHPPFDGAGGVRVGRLRGGKGQEFEGGVRMAGAAVWPGIAPAGARSHALVPPCAASTSTTYVSVM